MNCNLANLVGLAVILCACQPPDTKRYAMELAEQAMKTHSHNDINVDTTSRALHLLDSAIRLYPSSTFYLCKYQIYKTTNDQHAALGVCDTVLLLDKFNYAVTLDKGYTYEALGKLDSAFDYYRAALKLTDNPHSFNAAQITKDHEKIVISALLKDTAGFNKLVREFRVKYRDSKDEFFQAYSDEFDHFKRENYLQLTNNP
jgi:tetratricopeptide (TPR) repeat protein